MRGRCVCKSSPSLNCYWKYKELLSRLQFVNCRAEMNLFIKQRYEVDGSLEGLCNPVDFCVRVLYTEDRHIDE